MCETTFELPLRSDLYQFEYTKIRTRKNSLFAHFSRSAYGNSSLLDPKTDEELSRNGPPHIHFEDNFFKAYDCKSYFTPNELFIYQQIKLYEGTRKKLSDVDIVYSKDLRIN